MNFENIIGRTIDSFALWSDKTKLSFRFTDGTEVTYGVFGDCCSHSWIEHLELPVDEASQVRGLVITGVDEIEMARPPGDHGDIKVYETRFHTKAGDIVLEYRNSSNGYYGGELDLVSFKEGGQ